MNLPIFPTLVYGVVTMNKFVFSLIISYLLKDTNVVKRLWKMYLITVVLFSAISPNFCSIMSPKP